MIRSGHWRGFTNKAIRDVVHIGIGGSHLGPELVVNALAHLPGSEKAPNIHFVANVDANDINTALWSEPRNHSVYRAFQSPSAHWRRR